MKRTEFLRAVLLASTVTVAFTAWGANAMEGTRHGAAGEGAARAAAPVPAAVDTLFAAMTMKPGFGPSDHDAYEARIASFAAEHGMRRTEALTVTKFLGGTGPDDAATLGFWSLATPDAVQRVMGDKRYQAQMPYRNQIHDMAKVAMYSARAAIDGAPAPAGHVLLVGLIAMKPGFAFEDHAAYEDRIAAVTRRHGMRLVRAYRVADRLGTVGAGNVAAIYVWSLPTPDALGAIMQDPEYVANVPERDRTHDMRATTMYFASAR